MESSQLILYPTETVYGLGVNPFDDLALKKLSEYYRLTSSVSEEITTAVTDYRELIMEAQRFSLLLDEE